MSSHDESLRELQEMLVRRHLEVTEALRPHSAWRARLLDAVCRGAGPGARGPGADDLAAYAARVRSLSKSGREALPCWNVADLHDRFRLNAELVAVHLEAGRVEEARAAMAPDSELSRAVLELRLLLEDRRAA
jgi:hypothetical protein